MSKKPFSQTAFGRTISGRNKTGRIIHSVLDVLPVPNVHEVARRVVRDEERRGQVLTAGRIISESAKRLDWLRTLSAVGTAILIVKGSDWLGIDPGAVLDVLASILQL